VILGEQPGTLLIPQAALMQTQAGDQVLVVDQDDKVASRNVEVGPAYRGQWVIESGLKEGERVIVEGLQKARPGVVVAPKPIAAESA
jgi:membrane fusion protein (multidrug efflux system)